MINVTVNREDTMVSLEGNLEQLTTDFLYMARAVYKGIKKTGDIQAQIFKEQVLSVIDVCFMEDSEIKKRAEATEHAERDRVKKIIEGIEDVLAMFPKEEKK